MSDKVRTSGMRLSDLRPCSFCGGKIAPLFYLLEMKFAVVGAGANRVLGLTAVLGGLSAQSLRVAEAMSPDTDTAIVVSEEPGTNHKFFLCQECSMKPIDLALAIERKRDEEEKLVQKEAT